MFRAIRRAGYELQVVNILDDVDRIISAVRLFRPDVVFNLCEYFNDESAQEAWVAGLLEMLGQAFTGNPPLTLATCQNKYRTKLILEAAGLPTSPYFIARPNKVRSHAASQERNDVGDVGPERTATTESAVIGLAPPPEQSIQAVVESPASVAPVALASETAVPQQEGKPTASYSTKDVDNIPMDPEAIDHELDFPLIVKPGMEDASGGISHNSVVHDQESLEKRIRHIWKEFEMPALVEEYIDGREIHAAVIGNPGTVLPLFEMEFDDSEFNPEEEWRPQIISFRAKWDPHSKEFYTMEAVCPAQDLEPEMETYIREVALGAYKAMGCTDYARIDMRIDEEEDEVYILEVNPNPDLVDGAAFMMCATASGRTYTQTLKEILDGALERYKKKKEAIERAKAQLPTDQLLREFVAGDKLDKVDIATTGVAEEAEVSVERTIGTIESTPVVATDGDLS